jgi:hypothetical protein
MRNTLLAVALGAMALTATPSSAEVFRPSEITADGTWDCKDGQGLASGAVVVANKSYAVVPSDMKASGYGELYLVTTDLDLPNFAIISGPLKDDWHALGITMRGPKDNPHVWTGELFLVVLVSDTAEFECTLRKSPVV